MPDHGDESTLQRASRLRREIKDHSRAIENAQNSLESIERTCTHKWTANEQITVPALREVLDDSRSTRHGSDFDQGYRIEKYQKRAWRRSCTICGKEEITDKTKSISTQVPKF